MRKNQSIVILGKGNKRTKLTVGMALAFLDDANSGFMERIEPTFGRRTGKTFFVCPTIFLPIVTRRLG
jgi:hypothetical protein